MQMESAKQDVAAFISELIIFDLMLVEKRLQTIAKEKQKRDASQKEKEIRLLEVVNSVSKKKNLCRGWKWTKNSF
jgi:ribosome-binding ATPase YchF (GTP1/OBG family)